MKELIAVFQNLCNLYGVQHDLLLNREIVDINKDNYTEDDFVEAIYVYIQSFKEILSDFLIPLIKDDEEVIN